VTTLQKNTVAPPSGEAEFDPFAGPAVQRTAPSTEAQREIWTGSQIGDDASLAFNESVSLELRGPLDEAALVTSLGDLLERHEALRSTFSPDGTTLVVSAPAPAEVERLDLSGLDPAARQARLNALLAEVVERPFSLEAGPLVRLALVRLAADHHVLVFTAHHVVCDGFSTAVILKDLAAIYTARRKGVAAELPEAFPFSTYALEMRDFERTPEHAAAEKYWTSRFAGTVPVLDLPGDRPRPRLRTYPSRRHDHRLGKDLVAAVKKAGAKAGSSFFATMLAAFDVLLYRISGQDDLVVGIPTAGQAATGHPTLVGHCVNTLPVRVQLDPEKPFTELLGRARTALLDAQDHQLFTYGSLVRALAIPRDPSRLPLVAVCFNLDQGIAPESLAFDGLRAGLTTNPRHFETFDLFVNAVELGGEVVLECQYNTDLVDEATVKRWFEALERVLAEVAAKPDLPVSRIPILTPADLAVQAALNDTTRDWPRDRLLHQLVEEQVDRTPDAVAVAQGEATLTYAELDRRANRLAHHLRSLGAAPDTLVGLCLERKPEMLVAMLAVHKAGAAYVPLDPAFPAERLAFMVADSGMPLLVTHAAVARDRLPPHHAKLVDLDADASAIAAWPEARPAPAGSPDRLAYVLYTSGSTGKPKGVLVPVSAVVNLLWSVRSDPGLGPDDRVLAITTLSFDIAVFDLWLPLVVGGRILLAPKEAPGDGALLRRLLEEGRATFMQATPTTWRILLGAGWTGPQGFRAICTGEAMPLDLGEELVKHASTVWNMYGPTETTVWSTLYRLPRPVGQMLIGKPLANQQVHVLDRAGQRCPVGVPGELHIGGSGLARGYLGRPDLTAERFVADPSIPGARLYRTGDVCRLRVDGQVEYFGRNDSQVKVRGFRIELGEVESALSRHPGVKQAVAMAREDRPGDVRLVAYVVPAPGATPGEDDVRNHVRGILPEYMVPGHVVRMDAFPLTPSGKIDRKALPAPDLGHSTEEYVAPRTEAERLVATLWQEALGVPRIGIHDDFFKMGGHSLLAAQVAARLAREHGVALPMRRLFEAPTVAQFAPLLSSERPAVKIPQLQGDGPSAVSFMQERMWNLEQLQSGRAVFNLPAAFRLRGPLDPALMEESLARFVARHEAARTTLRQDGGEVVQVVNPPYRIPMPVEDMSAVPAAERDARLMELLLAASAEPFDLEKGPLLRARLFRMGADDHVVFFLPHHAIWDGWSFDIAVRDWSEIYSALREKREPSLPDLKLRYRDFSAWHRAWLRSPEVEKQAEWWRTQLAGDIPLLEMPADRPRRRGITDAGDTVWAEIDRAQADALTALGQRHGATLFMVLLAAFETVLHRFSGQDDLLVATPVRGRTQPETEDLVGTFINTLVLRTRFEGRPTFVDLLGRVRKTVLEAFAHEDVPFELLSMSNKPAYRALFSFQDARGRPTRFGDLASSQLHVLPPVAATDLTLWIMEKGFGLMGGLNFSTELFDRETMEQLLASFKAVLAGALADAQQSVDRLPLVAAGERAGLVAAPAPVPLVPDALAAHSARAPDAPALVGSGPALARGALAERAARLSGALRAAGLKPGGTVAIAAGSFADAVSGALAALGAGAAFLPLDPEQPGPGLARLLAAARPDAILADPGAGLSGAPVVPFDAAASPQAPAAPPSPGAPALLGAGPGRAAVSHAALAASCAGLARAAGLAASDVVLVALPRASGSAVSTALGALAAGASVLLDEEAAKDPAALRDALAASKATACLAPAWLWRGLVEAGWTGGAGVKALVAGPADAALSSALCTRAGAAVALHATDAGAFDGASRLEAGSGRTLLGAPFAGFGWRCLDPNGEPLPRGVAGRLAISHGGAEAPAGDRVKIRPDGSVEWLGRADGRLELRGALVDPAEVEEALREHPAVAAAAVDLRDDAVGEPRLVAWVVRRAGAEATDSELRAHLRERMPAALVPRHYVDLDALPGKAGRIERPALPSPFRTAAVHAPPRTPAEILLAELWSEALDRRRVGLNDNFFDLGGHSLLCLQVIAQIERRTGAKLSPKLLLLSTLEQVAAQLPPAQARADARG